MLQVEPIIPHEVQTGEAQKCTNNLQQNSKRKECQIENVNSHVEFRWSQKSELRQKVALESMGLLMQLHNSDDLIDDEDQKLNNSKKEELVPRYRFASPPYQEDHEKERV